MSSSQDRHGIPSTATDLELLRAHEPVVRFTAGEQFFPMDVERYVRSCSLWLYHPDDHESPIIFASAKGSILKDVEGNEYIDGLSCLWNVAVGHGREVEQGH